MGQKGACPASMDMTVDLPTPCLPTTPTTRYSVPSPSHEMAVSDICRFSFSSGHGRDITCGARLGSLTIRRGPDGVESDAVW